MKYLVSVIIPMYNSEKYIERCLNSLVAQSYKEIEIIIVDDGSTDSSVDKIQRFLDKRIKVFTKKNGGVSSARNFGIEKSNGEFLLFVDADDYIDENMVQELVSKVESNSTLVFCDNEEIWKNRVDTRRVFNENNIDLNKNIVMREIASGRAGLVCSKLVSAEVIKVNNIKFDEKLIIGEDQVLFLEVAEKTNNFKYVNKSLYYYDRTNENSATFKYHNDLYKNFLWLHEKVTLIFNRNNLNSEEDKILLNNKVVSYVWVCINNEVSNLKSKKSIGKISEILNFAKSELNLDLIDKNNINNLIVAAVKNNNKVTIFKIIVFIKLLNIKVSLVNKIRSR